jgi:hypothetical protein
MSVQAVAATLALDAASVTVQERCYLLVVASYADHEGIAWPGNERVAGESSLSVRAVQRASASCEEKGLIRKLVNGAPDERIPLDKRPNRVELLYARGDIRDTPISARGDTGGERGVTLVTPRGDTGDTQTVNEPPVEPSIEDTRATVDPFDAFWRHYPRKLAKTAARRAWNARMRTRVDPDLLVRSAERYAQVCELRETAREFIMHPATFLGPNERWLDYPPIDDGERALETGFYPAHLTNARPEDFAVGGC